MSNKTLHYANSIIFWTFPPTLLGSLFMLGRFDTIFLEFNKPTFLRAVDPYWPTILLLQIGALIISLLTISTAVKNQPHTAFLQLLFKLLPLIFVLIFAVTLSIQIFWTIFPSVFFWTNWSKWISQLLIYLFFLSNFSVAFALLKSQLSTKVLRLSLWISAVIVLGMALEVVAITIGWLNILRISEASLTGLEFFIGKSLFPPGNRHFWLFLGMTWVSLFGFTGIFIYMRGFITIHRKRIP
jgi:hypothetical protein